MAMKTPPRPTDAELAILKVLWRRGPSTVRQVLEEIRRSRPTGYTTVLKLLQIMREKGLVTREEGGRPHIYQATFSEERTLDQLVGDLLTRAFDGSASKLVMRALSTRKASREELAEVKKLLDDITASNGAMTETEET